MHEANHQNIGLTRLNSSNSLGFTFPHGDTFKNGYTPLHKKVDPYEDFCMFVECKINKFYVSSGNSGVDNLSYYRIN